jgi:hypothetical protein
MYTKIPAKSEKLLNSAGGARGVGAVASSTDVVGGDRGGLQGHV